MGKQRAGMPKRIFDKLPKDLQRNALKVYALPLIRARCPRNWLEANITLAMYRNNDRVNAALAGEEGPLE